MTITHTIRRWTCKFRGHARVPYWTFNGGTGMKCLRCGRVQWFGHGPGTAHYYQVPSRASTNLGDAA